MTSPTIQLEPGKSISFEKLKRILEKVEELQHAYDFFCEISDDLCPLLSALDNLLEVYENE